MLREYLIFSSLLIAVSVTSATAEEIELRQSSQAAVLHEGGVDMVVYFVEGEAGIDVIATYAAKETPDEPGRLVMHLAAGDDVTFALPGQPGTLYGFAHDGRHLNVSATPRASGIASIQIPAIDPDI